MFDKKKRKKLPKEMIFSEPPDLEKMTLTFNNIKKVLGKSADFKTRKVFINLDKKMTVELVYLEGLVDQKSINEYILKPLEYGKRFKDIENEKQVIHEIRQGAVYYISQKKRIHINDVISDIIDGNAALIFDHEKTAITFDTLQYEKRNVTEPTGENILKGAKDSFVETLKVNTATIRRKVRTPNLVINERIIGKQSKTPVCLIYIDGIVNKNIVAEIKRRLSQIETEGVLTTGIIEEALVKEKGYLFPKVHYMERVDTFCSNIIEGRVGVIIEGFPIAFIVPVTIVSFFQTPSDYSQNFIIGSLTRILRYSLMLTTLVLPGFYVSVATFHPEMIPTELAESIAASKQGVPFPIYMEVFIMLIAFEVLIEAGLRLPKAVGQTVSVVGALVVGEAAVNAKLVSPGVVLIIAITAIASFAMPNQDFSNALRVWRFVLAIFCSIIGLFGLAVGAILILFCLAAIESYGVPYLAPYVGSKSYQYEDTIIRMPNKYDAFRPFFLKTSNKKKGE